MKLLFRHVSLENQLEQTEGEEKQADSLEDRLTRAMAKVTASDYTNWIKHSLSYFGDCKARKDNL